METEDGEEGEEGGGCGVGGGVPGVGAGGNASVLLSKLLQLGALRHGN